MIRYLFATQSIVSRTNSEPIAADLGRGHGFIVALYSVLSVLDSHFGAKPAGCAADCSIGAGNVSDHRTDRPDWGLPVAEFMGLSMRQQILELPILGQWLRVRDDRSGRYECSNSISVPRED